MQHLDLMSLLAVERIEGALDEQPTRARRRRPSSPVALDETKVVLRLCAVRDDPALERLAELEGRPLAPGRHVVAEVDGTLVASQPLAGGDPYRDPFRATAHLLPLLQLRAAQLEPAPRRQHGLLRRHVTLIRGSIHA